MSEVLPESRMASGSVCQSTDISGFSDVVGRLIHLYKNEESSVLSHPFDKLPLNDGSTLIFTPCPGTKRVSLRDSMAQLAEVDTRALITLMPDDEIVRNDVSALPDVCLELGMRWFHFPIEDDTSPGQKFEQPWEEQKQQVFEILNQQMAIAIHCKGGSGRTGLMAAIILLERGTPFVQAVEQVRSLRPNALKLKAHTDYLAQTYNEKFK